MHGGNYGGKVFFYVHAVNENFSGVGFGEGFDEKIQDAFSGFAVFNRFEDGFKFDFNFFLLNCGFFTGFVT